MAHSKPFGEDLPLTLSDRAYWVKSKATYWQEIWESGPYFSRISECLEQVKEYAIFVGWQIDSRLCLTQSDARENPPETLKRKVIRLCETKRELKIYFLLWDHAYFYILERETWQGRVWEEVHPRVHFVFDNRHAFGSSHHEKLVIMDGKVAFCGGIDLCDGRRDRLDHAEEDPVRSLDLSQCSYGPYHDLAVEVRGPICREIQNHVARRWRSVCSIDFPEPPTATDEGLRSSVPGLSVYLSRTLYDMDAPVPTRAKGLTREVEFLFRDLIFLAQNRIILEGQYYWSKILNDLLISKMKAMKGKRFEVYLVLAELQLVHSFSRQMVPYQLELLKELEQAAYENGVRFKVGSPYVIRTPGASAPAESPPEVLDPNQTRLSASSFQPIYVHSKVIVIDDWFLGIGSANLATRALRVDSEIQLTLQGVTESERAHIRSVGDFILSHWNLLEEESKSAIQFRPLLREDHFKNLGVFFQILSLVPWKFFFDPSVPWFYFFKRRLRRRVSRRFWGWIFPLLGLWFFAAFLTSVFSGISWQSSAWPVFYTAAFSLVWVFPVPFFMLQWIAVAHLGGEQALRVSVSAFWVASAIGYTFCRIFPAFSSQYYQRISPVWLPSRLGLRSFPVLLSILLDPRISLCSKIAYQGIYSLPLPWFIVGTGLILPAFFFLVARLEEFLFQSLVFQGFKTRENRLISVFLLGLLVLSVSRVVSALWERKK
ncbi:MAG: hypothetical protein ACO3A2_04380 [Bdellovibrionia bacterium]